MFSAQRDLSLEDVEDRAKRPRIVQIQIQVHVQVQVQVVVWEMDPRGRCRCQQWVKNRRAWAWAAWFGLGRSESSLIIGERKERPAWSSARGPFRVQWRFGCSVQILSHRAAVSAQITVLSWMLHRAYTCRVASQATNILQSTRHVTLLGHLI